MTTLESDYIQTSPIQYKSKITDEDVEILSKDVIKVVIDANKYLHALSQLFSELKFDIYSTLGQRNLSGFIGEVFGRVFAKTISGYLVNPHADGRPDLLYVKSPESLKYFDQKCLTLSEDGGLVPNRSVLAPFKYGGVEVKTTIGSPVNNYKKRLKDDTGLNGFLVGTPRINYLSSITYWGHHTSCENLLGLYYDYSDKLNGCPQIMALMHASLDPEIDWNPVSVGKEGSKKTSNTSLSLAGREKICDGVVAVLKNDLYIEKLCGCGLKI